MFFVGATGQLLTLILTILLPVVFLISGHQNGKSFAKSFDHKNKIQYVQASAKTDAMQNIDFVSDELLPFRMIAISESSFLLPMPDFQVLWKCTFLFCSGNKAPPFELI